MSRLVVRVSSEVAAALRDRAILHGRSVEAEHRDMLRAALLTPPKSFIEHLLSMPPGLTAKDLRRRKDRPRRIEL